MIMQELEKIIGQVMDYFQEEVLRLFLSLWALIKIK